MTRAHAIPIVVLALLGLGLSLGAPGALPATRDAAAGRCVVVAKAAAKSKSEFDVTCGREITNGRFFIDVNRGGGVLTRVVPAGAGPLDCIAQGTQRAGQPWDHLVCVGSLTANATARLSLKLNFQTVPCDLPLFKGAVTVRFGDGASFGPKALSPYRCAPKTHQRWFSQFNSGSTPQGQGFIGGLTPKDGFTRCVRNVPVWIQRRAGSSWVTIVRTRTSSMLPRPSGEVGFTGLVGMTATVRAYAPRLRFGNQVCAAVSSRSAP